MARITLIAAMILAVTASSSLAESCERYRFGSQDWWQCKANQSGGPN